MIKIESIKDYQAILTPQDFRRLTDYIYDKTADLKEDYPNYREWFYDVQLAGLGSVERDILIASPTINTGNIIGVACLKNTTAERKLCTLKIDNGYRHLGISHDLVNAVIAELGTNQPFFTIPDYKLGMFQNLINQYDWQLEQRLHGYYNDRHSELCFNGKLIKTDELPTPTPRKKTTCVINTDAGTTRTTTPEKLMV